MFVIGDAVRENIENFVVLAMANNSNDFFQSPSSVVVTIVDDGDGECEPNSKAQCTLGELKLLIMYAATI